MHMDIYRPKFLCNCEILDLGLCNLVQRLCMTSCAVLQRIKLHISYQSLYLFIFLSLFSLKVVGPLMANAGGM